ncbi:MAG: hypothetical protein F6J94_15225 [Moorea sp. SIO1F2]|uniref:hypothetical protein n=2 Tax=unclassified Moorena TaxID=2683338 RepID=UPI0013BB067A|nr:MULTISPECIES: hypothetical protein [unclassified Moorena]NEO21664.1 hypothetical protein [Moorena sp. SIO4A5]NEQ59327.1 hypothetical protein [Moorena sp. SIO4A1]NET83226.1 hypothetical protein [Moorena sp. SIO1F2]
MESAKGGKYLTQFKTAIYSRNFILNKTMNVLSKKLLARTTLWLLLEIWLNFLGLDNLADYSEFIFGNNFSSASGVLKIEII